VLGDAAGAGGLDRDVEVTDDLAVRRDRQDAGVGRQLVDLARRELARDGADRVVALARLEPGVLDGVELVVREPLVVSDDDAGLGGAAVDLVRQVAGQLGAVGGERGGAQDQRDGDDGVELVVYFVSLSL
jgi:hypothetical protein